MKYLKVGEYLKNIIEKSLSGKGQGKELIKYAYYDMLSGEKIIELMGFKNQKALDTEKSDCIDKIRKQLIIDCENIISEFDKTPLTYWTKKIVGKYKE